ncbi:MAG: hypothetical protein AAGC60_03410 [Acidobacteriota bacterium]
MSGQARGCPDTALATDVGTFGNYDVVASHLDLGVRTFPRFMVDVDGDQRADFCRVDLPDDTAIAIRARRVNRDDYGGSDGWQRFYGKVDGRVDAPPSSRL